MGKLTRFLPEDLIIEIPAGQKDTKPFLLNFLEKPPSGIMAAVGGSSAATSITLTTGGDDTTD